MLHLHASVERKTFLDILQRAEVTYATMKDVSIRQLYEAILSHVECKKKISFDIKINLIFLFF